MLVVVVWTMSACKKDDDDKPKEGSAKDSADKSKEPTPSPGKPVGLLAVDNDPAVVAAAKLVLTDCASSWDPKQGWDTSCEAVEKFRTQKVEPRGKADATLINFFEDPDGRVRDLANMGVMYFGAAGYKTDPALATRLVAALEKETSATVDYRLARHVTGIDPEKIPLGERIKALALDPKTSNDIKVAVGAWWGSETSASNTFAFDVSKTLATSATDKRVKVAAFMGLGAFYDGHQEELCGIWNGAVSDEDQPLARTAMRFVAGAQFISTEGEPEHGSDHTSSNRSSAKKCPQVGAVIDMIDARANAGTIDDSDYVYALEAAGEGEEPPPEKAKAKAALKNIVKNKANTYIRRGALEALVRLDKSEKKWAQQWAKDEDLADTVKEINEEE